MNPHRTTTLKIRSQLLKPYRQVAKILGIPVASYLERYLQTLSSDLFGEPLQHIANEFWCTSYPTRSLAFAAAERFEAYAIEEKLKSNPDVGTIATSVVERSPGDWSVKASYLFKGGWKLIASDLWGDDDDDQDESDRWKKAS